jgi:hypothetical protein
LCWGAGDAGVMPLAKFMKLGVPLAIVLIGLIPTTGNSQASNTTYSKTRKLLQKMERSPGNQELKKLFEEADLRMAELIAALSDSDKQISVNAQVILNYIADPQGLSMLDEWYKKQKESGREVWMPKMEFLSEPKYLEGSDTDLAKLALKNKQLFEASRFNSGDVWIKVIGYNKRSKTALLEVVQGQILTVGWHAVIREENNRWRLISDNNVWVT